MINQTDILSAWQRIGWNEPSLYPSILDTDNKTSLSGLKFDALHALANFVMVKDTYPDPLATNAVLNALLTDWQKNSITEVVKDVFKSEDFIEQASLLYDHIDFANTGQTGSDFVGWKIIIPRGYMLTIKSVELLFDSAFSSTIYVFNESRSTNITTLAVSNSSSNVVSWTANVKDFYGSSSTLKSGTYYIGYFQSGTAKHILRNFYGQSSICEFHPIQATPNGVLLPYYKNIVRSGYTFGLNLDYVVRKDFTQDYLNNVDLFDRAISISVICKLLEQIHFSPRINQSERNAKEGLDRISAKAFLDLNGTAEDNPEIPYKRGLLKEYQDEVKNIRERIYQKTKLTVCTIK
jgi:hypothetical protein